MVNTERVAGGVMVSGSPKSTVDVGCGGVLKRVDLGFTFD